MLWRLKALQRLVDVLPQSALHASYLWGAEAGTRALHNTAAAFTELSALLKE